MDTRKKKLAIGAAVLAALIVLTLAAALTYAQDSSPAQGPDDGAADAAAPAVIAPGAIPIQGRLSSAGGTPLNGTYSVTFSLYEQATGGAAECSDTRSVVVTNGLFSDYMDGCYTTVKGQKLWLGVKVGSDPEMTPRQVLMPVPYALSLVPRAVISHTTTSAVLNVFNHGIGWAVDAYSAGHDAVHGRSDASNHAGVSGENTGGGTGVYGYSDTGAAVMAAGKIRSTADSYIFVPGSAVVREQQNDTTRWWMQADGSARLYRGATAGNKYVIIPITLPGVQYGQPVTVESVRIYYRCDAGNNYISGTDLHRQAVVGGFEVLASETTNRTSLTSSYYTLTPTANNVMGPDQGILLLRLYLNFANDTEAIQIGGVRVQLGHG